ncbi:hypothetical protein QH494_24505, partial [Sphingomonas sp. AR_OL41]|uniref:hypothetical protein n=1 Tax=Sphingomonas sp. AR_OL41 TaxID=3042729 RepID=UPI002480A7AA
MSVGRWCAVISCLSLVPPVAAQNGVGPSPAASPGAPTQAAPQVGTPDVVVNALLDRKRGDWKRAESEHVVVFSKDSADALANVTRNLERLHALLSRLYRKGEQADATVKLQVTLIGSAGEFRALRLRSVRAEEGPYPAAFPPLTYYDPGEEGDILAVAHSGQIIDVNTNRSYHADCDDALANDATDCVGHTPNRPPATRPWEALLYGAFAQRFIQTYVPAPYPRWYLDGIGALFSTVEIKANGAVSYGRPPLDYPQVFRAYGRLNIDDVLAGRYLAPARGKAEWTPYHAWLVAHYFLLANLKPERAQQFRAYMTAIHQGQTMAEAARAFGNTTRLERDIIAYLTSEKPVARAVPPEAPVGEPAIGTLSPGEAALVEARIELGARLAAVPADAAGAQDRDGWLAGIRDIAARFPRDAGVQAFAAAADCRGGHAGECLADAERALALSPNDVAALAWNGVALTDLAIG